ncbi:MAG: immune inhibitor A [Chloroflexota bacterium]|nr:immune inhibitor A [Chloroflexota bacterium]
MSQPPLYPSAEQGPPSRLPGIGLMLLLATLGLVAAGYFAYLRGTPLQLPDRARVAAITPVPTPLSSVTLISIAGFLSTTTPELKPPSLTPAWTAVPTSTMPGSTPATEAPISTMPVLSPAELSLQTLDAARVPLRDLYSLTARLKLKSTAPIARTVAHPATGLTTGHSDTFYMSDLLAKRYYTITATIVEVTGHVYWYAQDGRPTDNAALKSATKAFEEKIYPTDHRLFGSEWTPGVDDDPRITVLFASIPGAGGYFASADEYTRVVNPYSNQREIIYINTDGGWNGIESTLAHEFQHMIHWYEHPNHDVWLNEGASVLASALNGYDVVGVDGDFLADPDVQLNAWQSSPDAARSNYGASLLFLDYLRTHYGGDKVLHAVVTAPGQGTDAISNALASLGSSNRFEDAYRKWTLANLLDGQAGAAENGFDYPDRDAGVSLENSIDRYPKTLNDHVNQFGTDYIGLVPPQSGSALHVNFKGQAVAPIIPTRAHSGRGIWWSNRGDLADTSMTRSFDLSRVHSATLNFYTWFNIEEDLDYAYVEVSTDGGATWDTLKGTHTTSTNPNGNNFGSAYTGDSASKPGADAGGWLAERVDLAPYAGKAIEIRFEYVTDDGYNAAGFAVDDLSIPEIGYSDDAEAAQGWQSSGFAQVSNVLPQLYYLAAVKIGKAGFSVQPVQVGSDGLASFTIEGLSPGGPYSRAVLVVSGMTTHTIQPTDYSLKVSEEKP